MKILDRYVLITFIKNYLISLMVLLGLYIVLDMVFNFDEFAEMQQHSSAFSVFLAIASYYYHQSFLFFVQLSGVIPVVAAAFTLIRMSRFNELTAILAAGVPLLRVAMPIVYCGVVLNFLLLPLAQELVIPSMIPELTKKHDELEDVSVKTFPIRAMQDDNNATLNAGRYTPPDGDKAAHLDVVDVIQRDDKFQATGHITADSADFDPANSQWILINGQLVTGLEPDQKRMPPVPVATWKTNISPEEISLYRSGDYVELLATEKINELLQRPKSYGMISLLRVKHFRWSQLLVNIVLLLLAIPCVLTREPGTLKADVTKLVILTGLCMAAIFLAHQIAGNPPAGWMQQWPLIMAWVPIFVFLPLAIFLLDQKHTKKT